VAYRVNDSEADFSIRYVSSTYDACRFDAFAFPSRFATFFPFWDAQRAAAAFLALADRAAGVIDSAILRAFSAWRFREPGLAQRFATSAAAGFMLAPVRDT
jgi:hypothetical protein